VIPTMGQQRVPQEATHPLPPPVDAPDASASELIPRRAGSSPEEVVLELDTGHVSYCALEERLDRLAQWIVERTGGPGARVGIQTARTHELFLAALAVERAGATMVPIAPTAPPAWVGRFLDDCAASLLLSDVLPEPGVIRVPIADPKTVGAEPPPRGVRQPAAAIADLRYSSGSTGEPKGIVVSATEQRARAAAFYRLVAPSVASTPGRGRIAFLGQGSVGWMPSLASVVVRLGAVALSYELRRDGLHGLGAWLRDQRVSMIVMGPTLLRHFLAILPEDLRFPDLRAVHIGGEMAFWEDLETLWPRLGEGATVTSLYGMAELGLVTACSTARDDAHGTGALPVGTPIRDVEVTIEDHHHQVLPAGAVGEIVVRSPSSGSYWRADPDEPGFIVEADGRQCLRTRDLGRLRPDGNLEHLGRTDDVVKIGGDRVILVSVQHALLSLPDIQGAAVDAIPDHQGHVRLIAHVVATDGRALDAVALRRVLAHRLPPAGVPDRLAVVDGLPHLAHGKVDRQAVQALDAGTQRPLAGSRAGSTEMSLVADIRSIWSNVLGTEVGPDDDFFDLGGDSLRATAYWPSSTGSRGLTSRSRCSWTPPLLGRWHGGLSALGPRAALPPSPVYGQEPPPRHWS